MLCDNALRLGSLSAQPQRLQFRGTRLRLRWIGLQATLVLVNLRPTARFNGLDQPRTVQMAGAVRGVGARAAWRATRGLGYGHSLLRRARVEFRFERGTVAEPAPAMSIDTCSIRLELCAREGSEQQVRMRTCRHGAHLRSSAAQLVAGRPALRPNGAAHRRVVQSGPAEGEECLHTPFFIHMNKILK